MPQENEVLRNLSTRVRQLILLYRKEKQHGNALEAKIAEQDKAMAELRQEVKLLQESYKNLKTARILEVTDGDINAVKARISKLIRDVNKSLTLLGD